MDDCNREELTIFDLRLTIEKRSFWLELLVETGVVPATSVTVLTNEANELLAIFGASQLTAKQNVSGQVFNRQS